VVLSFLGLPAIRRLTSERTREIKLSSLILGLVENTQISGSGRPQIDQAESCLLVQELWKAAFRDASESAILKAHYYLKWRVKEFGAIIGETVIYACSWTEQMENLIIKQC